jgi:hypothetical protein
MSYHYLVLTRECPENEDGTIQMTDGLLHAQGITLQRHQ